MGVGDGEIGVHADRVRLLLDGLTEERDLRDLIDLLSARY